MVGCAAVACKNNSSFETSNGVESFYRLPRDSKLKRTWLANIKILYPKEENTRVCHLHFEETCFQRDLKTVYIYTFFIIFFKFCLL